MYKIISGVLLVICVLVIGFLLVTLLKFLAAILLAWFIAYLCWLPIRDLFKDE